MLPTSYVQDSAHVSKSDRFVPVQASQIGMVLADHGFQLGHLKAGKARKEDRAHHQTTIARYISNESSDIVKAVGHGSTLDLLVKVPHLTGAVEFRLGFFRGACANQWNAGKLIANLKVPHMGDCLSQIDRAIPALVSHRDELCNQIQAMQARRVTASELAGLARRVCGIRMDGIENAQNVQMLDLVRPRRAEDRSEDLFTVANVLQENALRHGIRYTLDSVNRNGRPVTRHMETRRVIETTATAMEMTGSIWEAAAELLK